MENGFLGFRLSSNLISDASNNGNNGNIAPLGFEYEAPDVSLVLNSHSTSNLHISSSIGSKRKLNDMHGKDFLSLGLGLQFSSSDYSKGCSVTDCTTISSSAKETTNEESCIDSGLDFQLHIGNHDNLFSPKVPDLNLSLSVGPTESVITNIVEAEPSTTESIITGTNPPRNNTSAKTCTFQGCTKGARGASRLCIAHGGGRRCQKQGCSKGAEGKTIFCKSHGGGRRCQFLGCTKSAEGRTDHCIAHGGGRRCTHSACTRAARGKSGLCIRHGGGKRCRMENCTRSAEGYYGLCISHGGGRRCQHPECAKGAQGSTMYCKAHGGGKRCIALGCTKGAEGSTPYCKGHGGGKRCAFDGGDEKCPKSVHGGTMFCVRHGGGKRCAVSECTKSARGSTNFCVRHGGGRRCRFEGCGKSAQGRTDFCKAHGGGKRCLWGGGGCDGIARGRTGMCAVHGGLVRDVCVHGGSAVGVGTVEKMKGVSIEGDVNSVSIPEGRVHGGSFLAFLSKDATAGCSLYGGMSRPM